MAYDHTPAWRDVPPGTRAAFTHPVTHRADGTAIGMPVLVARGPTGENTLLVTAGIHGDEYEGMRPIQAAFASLKPERLRGTVVGVPVVNVPAFEAGLRVNPDDRQDLARVFPGDPAGTVTEQIAYALTHRFIRHANLFCDLHSAGQYYAMPPLAGYALHPEPMLGLQRHAAKAFGLPLIWGTPPLPGRSLSAAAEYQVPAIYAEVTGEGRCRPANVTAYVNGIRSLLGVMGITDDTIGESRQLVIEDTTENAGFLQRQMRTTVGGLFEAEVRPGDRVTAGQALGSIRDPFGIERFRATAAVTGIVVFVRTFNRVLAGDPLCYVLEVK